MKIGDRVRERADHPHYRGRMGRIVWAEDVGAHPSWGIAVEFDSGAYFVGVREELAARFEPVPTETAA